MTGTTADSKMKEVLMTLQEAYRCITYVKKETTLQDADWYISLAKKETARAHKLIREAMEEQSRKEQQ
jgi:hypothetical protein